MSKASKKPGLPAYRDDPTRPDSSSAISLAEDIGRDDEDTADLPPYSDHDDSQNHAPSASLTETSNAHAPTNNWAHTHSTSSTNSCGETISRTTSAHLSTDPASLAGFINRQARIPPQPIIHIKGTHSEKRTESTSNGTTTKKIEVVDFDIKVDFTPYIIRKSATGGDEEEEWNSLWITPENSKAYNGSWRKTPIPAPGGPEEGLPARTLGDWAQLYCSDDAKLKTFVLHRQVTELSFQTIHGALTDLIRQTLNYRGHLNITFETHSKSMEVWSPHIVNRWRTSWVRWLFYLSFLWIFTWPILFFMTHRYEVLIASWPFAKMLEERRPDGSSVLKKAYAVVSEENWVRRYSPAIKNAVLGRKQGWMNEEDLLQSEAEWARIDDLPKQGLGGMVGNALRGVLGVEEDLRILRGWGGDEY